MHRFCKCLNIGLPYLLLFAYLAVLLERFSDGTDIYLSYFTDDFFYYATIARNWVGFSLTSFNGIQPTNGYHPLWLMAIALLYRVFGGQLDFFVAVVILIWLLVVGTFVQIRRIQNVLMPGDETSLPMALFSIIFMAVLSRTGMEVSLALFFLAVFWHRMAKFPLETQHPLQAVVSGLIASCLVLSRIDSCIAVMAYGALGLLLPSGPRRLFLRNGWLFIVGLAPIVVYLVINKVEFDTFLPISGLAKNLKMTAFPSASTVDRLITLDGINLLVRWPSAGIAAIYLARWRRPAGLAAERVRLGVILHPVLFYGTLTFTSDWQMWAWYLYPLVPIGALVGPVAIAPWTLGRLVPRRRD